MKEALLEADLDLEPELVREPEAQKLPETEALPLDLGLPVPELQKEAEWESPRLLVAAADAESQEAVLL